MIKVSQTPRKWKILVTPKEACESLSLLPPYVLKSIEFFPTFDRLKDPKKLIELMKDKEGVVLDLEPITKEILKHCPEIKVISRFGEGCDAIDLESVKKLGIRVARTRAVSSLAVARHTMSLILAVTHNITENDRNLKNGLWKRQPNISEEVIKLGILGFGKIGSTVADLANAYGFEILVYTRRGISEKYQCVNSLEELVVLSDIISLHLPLNKETKNIISGNIIDKFNGKYLVNTARGGIVDETVLFKALKKNEISGYAADVFLHEPISGISKNLVMHPKVICSPHIAALDHITNVKVTERAVKNALYCLENEHEKVNSYVV